MSRIARIALVALLALGAVANTAWAEAGAVQFNPETSPHPELTHVRLFGETPEEFLAVYHQALANGFTQLEAPRRILVPDTNTHVWIVAGYLDPEFLVTEPYAGPRAGKFEDGTPYKVLTIRVATALEMIQVLQEMQDLAAIPVGQIRLELIEGTADQYLWVLDVLGVPADEGSPAAS